MASRLFHALVVVGSSMVGTAAVVGTSATLMAACGNSTGMRDAAWWPDIGIPWWPDIEAQRDFSVEKDQSWWPDIGVPPIDMAQPEDAWVIIDGAPVPRG